MAKAIGNTDRRTDQKITAEQVENCCPDELQELAKRISVQYEKARRYEEKADQHDRSIGQHLAKAREACDEGAFNAFREKFCPYLGKSRVYELLAIGENRKSLEETRKTNRERVAKHRAAKSITSVAPHGGACFGAAAAGDQGVRYVTDEPEPHVAPREISKVAGNTGSEPTPEPQTPRRAYTPNDQALITFSAIVVDLLRRTAKQRPERFAATSVPADDLARLGKFLTDVASLAKSRPRLNAIVRHEGNVTVSAEESAEEMKAKFAALAADTLAA
jgi:hypothetical protein